MDAETAGSAAVQCRFHGGWQRVTRSVPETATSAFTRYVTAVRLRNGVDRDLPLPELAALTDKMTLGESAEAVTAAEQDRKAPTAWREDDGSGFEPEPEPLGDDDGGDDGDGEPTQQAKRGKQVKFTRPKSKNVEREPEARAW